MVIRHYHVDKASITYDKLAENTIQIAIPIHLLAKSVSVAIGSTGVKEACGHFTLTSEMIKHLKEAYLEANADTPSATDATVNVELYDSNAGSVIASVSFAGAGGTQVSSDISTDIKNAVGHVLYARINVATASATTGATQTFRSIVLRLVLGIS